MMQKIATGNTDIAAFSLESSVVDVGNLKSANEFAYMLKYQQTDDQPRAQSHKSAQNFAGRATDGSGAEQPGASKRVIQKETANVSAHDQEAQSAAVTHNNSDSQINSQNDDESDNFVEENQWLLQVEKLVNEASDLELQQEVSEQLNATEELNVDTSEAHNALSAMLSSLFSTDQQDGEIRADLQGEISSPLGESQQSSEEFAEMADAALTQLIQLPEDQLDKVLAYLEQKLTANLGLDKTAGVSDFVAALKTGIAEVKAQLSQGREPGIDLKGLVNEALKATGESTVVKSPEQLDLTLKAFKQTLEFAQQLSSTVDQSLEANVINNSFRELGQLQGEQVKSSQLQSNQLHTSQLDKALNLAKPEAHQQLAEKVRWMVNHRQLVADIRLDPAELGSMHVKVSLAGESASVSFVVNSAQAKEAVDNATPKLREMLAEKGIELGQSSVEQEQNPQQQQMAGNGQHSEREEPEEGAIHEQVMQQPIVNGALGGIDYFV
ncbi:MAG: flagellar hook-length control protein FliK [Paraglaciecola sp.]|jgi:flagellar hook-length control protein FliK